MKLKGYRTILVMALTAIPPTLDLLLPVLLLPEWKDVIPESWWAIYCLGVQILAVYLRAITTTPLGRSQ